MTQPPAQPPEDAHVRAVAEGIAHAITQDPTLIDRALHVFGDPVTGNEPSLLPFEIVPDAGAAELAPHLVRHSGGEAR